MELELPASQPVIKIRDTIMKVIAIQIAQQDTILMRHVLQVVMALKYVLL